MFEDHYPLKGCNGVDKKEFINIPRSSFTEVSNYQKPSKSRISISSCWKSRYVQVAIQVQTPKQAIGDQSNFDGEAEEEPVPRFRKLKEAVFGVAKLNKKDLVPF